MNVAIMTNLRLTSDPIEMVSKDQTPYLKVIVRDQKRNIFALMMFDEEGNEHSVYKKARKVGMKKDMVFNFNCALSSTVVEAGTGKNNYLTFFKVLSFEDAAPKTSDYNPFSAFEKG